MQRLIEMVNLEEERNIIFNAINKHVLDLAYHTKGNYVILAIIQIMKPEQLNPIFDSTMKEIKGLSMD